jgi:hypothetical protein
LSSRPEESSAAALGWDEIADNLRLFPSPITAAEVSATLPFVIPSELRISYYAALINGNVCGFLRGKAHELERNHEVRQEIRR